MPDPTRRRAPVGATSPMPPPPAQGRAVHAERRVRLGDVRPDGRARLDAVARWCQDVAADDVREAGVEGAWRWVVRRTLIEVVGRRPVYDEPISVVTWCSGIGAAWAERRTTVTGARGGRIEVAAVWVAVDPVTMRPMPLGAAFADLYGAAAGDRRVKAGLLHASPPEGLERTTWPVRVADLDALGHVNNAIAWALLEELAPHAIHASAEYRTQLRGGSLDVVSAVSDGTAAIWACEPGGPVGVSLEASTAP